MKKNLTEIFSTKKNLPILILSIFGSALVTAAGISLILNIQERKAEAEKGFFSVVDLTDETEDPEVWGRNFPHQYDQYKKTVDQVRTRYGGSEAIPRTPTLADPRSIVAQSRLEEDPRLRMMWAGYPFSVDFREKRGHAFMLIDQMYTERQRVVKQPGTCIHCHASTYVPMLKLGYGDLTAGFEQLNQMPYTEARKQVTHPVACIDCHNPKTMQLRVTRPAFMEGIAAYKKTQGISRFDVNRMATHQEMRTYVCSQCHVEYFFKGEQKRLTFPWAKGIKADEILNYYDSIQFKDWIHQETGAPVLKAQHPEFEMWSQGVHARSGVSCTDCHMPYQRLGAVKITDHHVRSPLLNVNRACQTCHRWPESELISRVEQIQERNLSLRNVAMDALIDLIQDLKETRKNSEDSSQTKKAQEYHRRAQFLLDFVESENSSGFHAPQEAARLLGISIDSSRKGQVILRKKIESNHQSILRQNLKH